jgi:hypothetical protein
VSGKPIAPRYRDFSRVQERPAYGVAMVGSPPHWQFLPGPARRFRRTWHAERPLERQIAETALMGESALQRISQLQAQREGTNGH